MRFSLEKKFIYLANMKTGSTSVRNLLTPHSDHEGLLDEGLYAHHWNAKKYKSIFEEKGWVWDSFYSFTTIRNPWARIVSFYNYGRPDSKGNHKNDANYDESTALQLSFEDWLKLRYRDGESPRLLPNIKQFAYIKGKKAVSEIYKIESLNEHKLRELLSYCNLESEFSSFVLPHSNSTKAVDYRSYYSPELVDIISTHMQSDIELGGYEFED